ncbi:unnamed protein product [Trichobilharzia regenti]|nr:unnamed protein product [Trichobilharzia regenti]
METSSHVFVRHESVRRPLEAPYDGAQKLIKRADRFFVLVKKGREDTVSINYLKQTYLKGNPINPELSILNNTQATEYALVLEEITSTANLLPGPQRRRVRDETHHDNVDHELSEFFTKLYHTDENAAVSGKDYLVNLQGHISGSTQSQDKAPKPLFEYVNEDVLKKKPTFAKFIALLDNYCPQVGITENVTEEEIKEEDEFIEELMKTKIMKMTYEYLLEKQKISGDMDSFKEFFKKIWFKKYTRKRISS